MYTTIPADDNDVRVYDQGQGPAILVVGPGLDDGRRTKKLAALLADRFRVLRLHRRQYRPDLKTSSAGSAGPCPVAREVDDILAVARHVGRPLVIYGHSSGGVVALEALAESPSSFAGAVIFEPAAVTGKPLAGEDGEIITRARKAIEAGRPGKALEIFVRDVTGHPAWQAWTAGLITTLIPRYRRLVPCQIDDLEALDRLGNRLSTYAEITVPTVLLGGDRSPRRITAVLDALDRLMPHAERVVLHNRDHGADLKAPKEVAHVIRELAGEAFQSRS